jgi:hypothetical protein
MPKNNTGFRPLVRETGQEPFKMDVGDWNKVIDYFNRNQRLFATSRPEKGIPHPWKLKMRWDYDLNQWVFSVRPGFVRGHDVYVTTLNYLLSQESRDRLQFTGVPSSDDKKTSKVPIVETPEIAIGPKLWQAVATDTLVVGSESRAVPPPLQTQYNIIIPEQLNVDTEKLELSVDVSENLEQSRETARVLYCVDLFLRQPRASVSAGVLQDGPDPSYLESFVQYTNTELSPPYLVLSNDSPIEAEVGGEISVSAALAGQDTGYDVLPIATIWIMGPVGDLAADEVDESWQPIVEYHTFYNLDHTVDIEIKDLPPLRQINPAAGLLSGVAVQAAVEIVNETNRQAAEAYQKVLIQGKFWTV